MISLAEAQARLLALAAPLPSVTSPLAQASGHYLAQNVIAGRTQPAADLSAMDGYVIRFADMPGPWRQVGESAAGATFSGKVGAGETVRIFTGAHVPNGADTILLQEDVASDGVMITLTGDGPDFAGKHIRRTGTDFLAGDTLLSKGQYLGAGAIALAAMAGLGRVLHGGRAKVTIIATGDELVAPGASCSKAQIPSSNSLMLAAMLEGLPCDVVDYGVVPDSLSALIHAFADCAGSDVVVTTGGASVGDHDYVQEALKQSGATIDFWRIAMKPGKPVMAGKLGNTIFLGLPGNPSSAYVTAFLLLLPLVRHLSGCAEPYAVEEQALLANDIPATESRAEYMRGYLSAGEIKAFQAQDSGLVTVLAQANALIIRPAFSSAEAAGGAVSLYRLS